MNMRHIAGLAQASLVATLILASSPTTMAETVDNDELRDLIDGIGVAHNVAFPPSLSPEPFSSIIGGSTTYATNLGLKYVPPVIRPPIDTGAVPNSVDGCSYTFSISGEPVKSRNDFLGILTKWTGDDSEWSSFLGNPFVYHVNTDVNVSVHRGSEEEPLSGSVTLPVGKHRLRWRGATQITPILDYPPWHLLLSEPIEAASRRAATAIRTPAGKRAIIEPMIELAINLGVEGAAFGIGWQEGVDLSIDTPTKDGVGPIINEHFQSISIYDRIPPEFTPLQTEFVVEATQVGGELLRDHIARMREGFEVTDACDRRPIVNYNGPPFLPVGEVTEITWTARDLGPVDLDGGFNTETFVQRIRVQDTKPPIVVAPPGQVVESDASTAVDIGHPAVFDLADVRPTITNDAPATFEPNTRTLVTWTAEDASGNSTSRNQWITLKTPGSNTAPTADSVLAATRTEEDVVISLAGSDPDFLSGRYDQLSFRIVDPPRNGFFVAELLPYFIEDHRVENEFGLNKFELNDFLDEQCAADSSNYVPPIDFVRDPRYMTVTDDGIAYVSDSFYQCFNGAQSVTAESRISRWIKNSDGELEYDTMIDLDGSQPDSLSIGANGNIYYRGVPADATQERVRGCDEFLENCQTFNIRVDTSTNNPNGQYPRGRLASFVVDENDVLFVTDGQRALAAYDLTRIINSNDPLPIGVVGAPGDIEFGGVPGAMNSKDLAIDSEGNLYLSDIDFDRVYKFSASGTTRNADGSVDFQPGELIGWMGRCTGNKTEVRACDEVQQRSIGYTCTAELCEIAGDRNGTGPGQFNEPKGIAMDANDVLYVTDSLNLRIQRFTSDGYFAGEAVSECDGSCFVLGDFGKPHDVSANLQFFYVLDRERDLLHVFETTPITEVDDETGNEMQTALVTYRSNRNVKGTDSFSYTVTDGLATSPPATVTIGITRNQRPPIATEDQVFEGQEDVPLDFRLAAFDPDEDDQPILTYDIVQQPEHGQITGVGPDFTYTPDPDFFGDDTFTFTTSDSVATSNEAEVTISMAPVNDVPLLTFADMNDGFGAGFPIKAEVTFNDVDTSDLHVYGIDWGPGEPYASGRALPPGQVSGPDDPDFFQAAGGSAVLVDDATYFDYGLKTITVCASDVPDLSSLSSCNDPNVTAVVTRDVLIEPRVLKGIKIRDDAPTETDELGNEWNVPIMDGTSITSVFTLHNLEPNDVPMMLDATSIEFNIEIGDGLQVGPFGIYAITGAAVNPQCTAAETTVSCTADSLAPGAQMGVAIDIVGDGSVGVQRDVPVYVTTTSAEPDHSGMTGTFKNYPIMPNPDGDADGDGVANADDAFPEDPGESSDLDGDGIGDNADLDDDNDSLPDAWEQRFGLNSRDAADALLDADGDGVLNGDEFAAGTRPDTADTDRDSVGDGSDNCSLAVNRNQFDQDGDGRGDACDADSFAALLPLGDLDGAGGSDYGLVRTSAGLTELFLKDSETDLSVAADRILLGAAADETLIDLAVAGDTVAVILEDASGQARLEAHALATGVERFSVPILAAGDSAIRIVAAGDELWVGYRSADGGTAMSRRAAATGAELGAVSFAAGIDPVDVAELSNGHAALLGVDEASGEVGVEIRNPDGDIAVGTTLIAGPDALSSALTASADGFAVAVQYTDGEIVVSTWGATGASAASFNVFDAGWTLLGISALSDVDGASDALLIAAVSASGALEVRIVDAADGTLISTRSFGTPQETWRGSAVAAIGTRREIAVVLADATNGIKGEVQDAAGAAGNLRSMTAASASPPPPAPPPPSPPPPPAPPPPTGTPPAADGGGGGATGWMLLALAAAGVSRRRRRMR